MRGRSAVEARQIHRHRLQVKKIHLTSVQETTMEREPVSATLSLEVALKLQIRRRVTERGTRPELAQDFEKRMPLQSTKPSDAELSDANL